MNPDRSKYRIEVLDDEIEFCNYVRAVASGLGFEVTVASSPRTFIDNYSQSKKDILFLDLFMPGIDGVELLRFMAAEQPPEAIILMSGRDSLVLKSAQKLAKELGLNVIGIIWKPIRKNELEKILLKIPLEREQSEKRPKANLEPSIQSLKKVIQLDDIDVVFQPQFNCENLNLYGVEALARWRDPQLGDISPVKFISIAESAGLIEKLDRIIMKKAMSSMQQFQRYQPDLRLSLNMSAHTLTDLSLPELVSDELNKFQLSPSALSIEVTETAVMQDLSRSLDILTRLRMKGVCLSIDDFGTGYSSMSQLVRFPFSELKIDRSFVQCIDDDNECKAIVKASISLARELNMRSVAEGVSSESILKTITNLNCDQAQGFHLGKPMQASSIVEQLQIPVG